MRVGAVNYLNSKPLVCGLENAAPHVRLSYDLPSRLADSLQAGRLDVALIPSIEFFRAADHRIVSDACVACRGSVLSVKLLFRVPPREVRRVALDEGSRTSAALAQILLAERCGLRPMLERLPIGSGLEDTNADAVLLIGDRAIGRLARAGDNPARNDDDFSAELAFVETWDLGEVWSDWTSLPFVFAMWVARKGVDISEVSRLLEDARDRGMSRLYEIAQREGAAIGVSTELAAQYLRDNLHFTLGNDEYAGLKRFNELCEKHGLAPTSAAHRISPAGGHAACGK